LNFDDIPTIQVGCDRYFRYFDFHYIIRIQCQSLRGSIHCRQAHFCCAARLPDFIRDVCHRSSFQPRNRAKPVGYATLLIAETGYDRKYEFGRLCRTAYAF